MGKTILTESHYTLTSEKTRVPVTIAVIADLHNTGYGVGQSRLIRRMDAAAPDAVAIVGDAFHARLNEQNTLDALSALSEKYPCYYVTGNHESTSSVCEEMKNAVRAAGVTTLGNQCSTVVLRGQTIQICGLDDYERKSIAGMYGELVRVSANVRPELLSVLLVHRPERMSDYLPCGFDVILAGHAHGGQWRIPGARNGLIAPGQGCFPHYTCGAYAFGAQTMFVSRGLSNKPLWLARFGNPPEIMFVTITPA